MKITFFLLAAASIVLYIVGFTLSAFLPASLGVFLWAAVVTLRYRNWKADMALEEVDEHAEQVNPYIWRVK